LNTAKIFKKIGSGSILKYTDEKGGGDYWRIYQARKKLEKEGFSWSEKL